MTFDIRAGRGGGVQNGQKTSDVTNGRLEENHYNIIHMHNFLGINIGEQFNKISTLILYWTDFTAFIRAYLHTILNTLGLKRNNHSYLETIIIP